MGKKKKFYVVWQGVEPGIYESWDQCKAQIQGFPNASYKSFPTLTEAQVAYTGQAADFVSVKKTGKTSKKTAASAGKDQIIWDSLSVDAACSGNPGKMEYQGVDTTNGDQIFHKAFQLGTNNIGEFLAIVHGLAHLKNQNSQKPIYTDSKIALGWVQKKKCRTKLVKNAKTEYLYSLIDRAENWLKNNEYPNKIIKWDTENWGEIPADFGRK